jgi:hypothetical protein
MVKHVKPTNEELEANMNKALDEAEALKSKPHPEKMEEKPEKPLKPEEKMEEKPEKKEDIDYKKKFVESSKESLILHAKNKKISEALERATLVKEPTEEELRKEYTDWDVMGEFEKKMAKDSLINSRRFSVISEIAEENKNLEAWQSKVDGFIDDPAILNKYPELDGREDEFRLFATKPTRKGVDFEDLVSAFLYSLDREVKPSKKKQMFEEGSAGPNNSKPKSDKISMEEGRQLRNSDYKKWSELVKKGMIEMEEL